MTTMRDLLEIQAMLHAYGDLSECVVKSIVWSDYGTTVAITFDYIWTTDGRVRGDDEERLLVELKFKLVQEFEMKNALRPSMVAEPAVINWGLNEVAQVLVRDDDRSEAYAGYPVPFHHAVLRWEGTDWIHVVFSQLEIKEESAPPAARREQSG